MKRRVPGHGLVVTDASSVMRFTDPTPPLTTTAMQGCFLFKPELQCSSAGAGRDLMVITTGDLNFHSSASKI